LYYIDYQINKDCALCIVHSLNVFPFGQKNDINKHPAGCHSERSEDTLESADSNRFY